MGQPAPIHTVHLWANGMTMAFDAFGQQLPEHQGPWLHRLPAILEAAGPETRWTIGVWREGVMEISREMVECLLEQLLRPLPDPLTNG